MTPESQKPDNDRLVNLRDLEALREEIRAILEDIRKLNVPRRSVFTTEENLLYEFGLRKVVGRCSRK